MDKENIIFIHSSALHPQANRVVEAFNKTIIKILELLLLEEKDKFDINKAIQKGENIYNNTIHTNTKIEPIKAFKLKDKNVIENVIQNIIKSQANKNNNKNNSLKKVINPYLMKHLFH